MVLKLNITCAQLCILIKVESNLIFNLEGQFSLIRQLFYHLPLHVFVSNVIHVLILIPLV